MRIFVILGLVAIGFTVVNSTQTFAQSGSRGGGAISSAGGGGISGASGSLSGSSTGGFSGFGGRLSRADRQLRAQQQLQLQQAQAQQNARVQAEQARLQYKQSLIQLGLPKNRSQNSTQYRAAFQEARKDYQALRSNRLAPNQLGTLKQPFRLNSDDVSRDTRMAHWPDALQASNYRTLVENLDQTIMTGGVTNKESAQKFLKELQTLNVALNTSAVQGNVSVTDFARARRFITGLANEIHSSDLIVM